METRGTAAAGFRAQRGSRLRRLEATEALTLNMADNVSTRLPLFSLPLTHNRFSEGHAYDVQITDYH